LQIAIIGSGDELLVEERNSMVNDVPEVEECVEYTEGGVLLPEKLEQWRGTRR